jgi:hypothetical protein
MLEIIAVIVSLALVYCIIYLLPLIRHYQSYKHERKLLEKRYTRLWKSR